MWMENKSCPHFAATAKPSVQSSHTASTPLSPESAGAGGKGAVWWTSTRLLLCLVCWWLGGLSPILWPATCLQYSGCLYSCFKTASDLQIPLFYSITIFGLNHQYLWLSIWTSRACSAPFLHSSTKIFCLYLERCFMADWSWYFCPYFLNFLSCSSIFPSLLPLPSLE